MTATAEPDDGGWTGSPTAQMFLPDTALAPVAMIGTGTFDHVLPL
jgi:hypothetical protein